MYQKLKADIKCLVRFIILLNEIFDQIILDFNHESISQEIL